MACLSLSCLLVGIVDAKADDGAAAVVGAVVDGVGADGGWLLQPVLFCQCRVTMCVSRPECMMYVAMRMLCTQYVRR